VARRLENWLTAYSLYTEISEAPLTFDFWTGIGTIAGALQRQVFIDEIKFKIYPNFYIIFVAPPGIATKSTTTGVGMKLLKKIDSVRMGPASMTWQGLTRGLQEAHQLIPMSDPKTTDPLAMEYISQSVVTCEVSELGTFLDMRDGALLSVLIDLWDGKDVSWERWLSTQDNTNIENPLINIIGATTPNWLEENFNNNTIEGGLTSRIIFVYGDAKRRIIPFISDLVDPGANTDLENALVHDLKEISKLKGKFNITREARNFVGDWYYKHWSDDGAEREVHLKDPKFAGYCARKFAHLMKLSSILSVAESDSLVIELKHVQTAFAILVGLEGNMLSVFSTMGKVISSKHMDVISAVLRTRRKVEKFSLWRTCMNSMNLKEFAEAIDGLVEAGYVIIRNEGGTYYYCYHFIEADHGT